MLPRGRSTGLTGELVLLRFTGDWLTRAREVLVPDELCRGAKLRLAFGVLDDEPDASRSKPARDDLVVSPYPASTSVSGHSLSP